MAMKQVDDKDTELLFSLQNDESKIQLPIGFHLLRPMGSNITIYTEESTFHQTTNFPVGNYYKPIAHILTYDGDDEQ